MKVKSTVVALLLAAGMVTSSYGADKQFLDGAKDHYIGSFTPYAGYFVGYVDAMVAERWFTFGTVLEFKYPAGVKSSQLRDVVAKYVHEHPEKHHETHSQIVRNAIREAWPEENKDWPKYRL